MHCEDAKYREQLRNIGPMVSVGASASGGLFAKSFPLLAANQLCLGKGSGFESQHSFSGETKFAFLKKTFIQHRPKVVVALDHLHHSSKNKKFNAETQKYIDAEIAMLTLDCKHPMIDCSPDGDFNFVAKENYKPIVLLGDVYAFYAVDCTKTDPFFNMQHDDNNVGCIDDYDNINKYLWQRARETPNLIIFPVDAFYRNLHQGLPFVYDVGGQLGSFYTRDMFWDGFHPWSEPGAQILANLVLMKLNQLIETGAIPSSVTIPYIKIDEKYFKPYTGVVLISDVEINLPPGKNVRVMSEHGEALSVVFSDQTKALRNTHGDWRYFKGFEKKAKPFVERTGTNPLVIKMNGMTEKGDIIVASEQHAVLRKVLQDSRNQLLGGIITTTEVAQ